MLRCHTGYIGKLEMDFKLLTDKTYNNPYINQGITKY